METPNLWELANRTRFTREASVALLLGSCILALFFFFPLSQPTEPVTATTSPDPYAALVLTAQAAIVYDLVTGEVLYEKNADVQLPLASLTKLLTIEAAVRELSLDMPIKISDDDVRVDTPRRFAVGDTLALKDMARLTLTASLNDGASAIAAALAAQRATSTPAALQAAATALGLSTTYAVNGNGLDFSDAVAGGYGSARHGAPRRRTRC